MPSLGFGKGALTDWNFKRAEGFRELEPDITDNPPPAFPGMCFVMRKVSPEPSRRNLHIWSPAPVLGGSSVPQNLGSGQRWVYPTRYRDGPVTSSSHRFSTHHSSLLSQSIPLVDSALCLHPTRRSNGECVLAFSPNLAMWQELSRPRRQRNL